MTDLDKSMIALLKKHGLKSACVTVLADSTGGHFFSISIQWEDDADRRDCIVAHGDTTTEALGKALAEMADKRIPALSGELAA